MKSPSSGTRRTRVILTSAAGASVLLFSLAIPATAAIVAKVPLATSAEYSVLAGSTVTNTGPSILGESLGVSPGTSITGFPPGTVLGTTNATNAAAAQAESDLTAAYLNAEGRPINGTTTADLANLNLQGGVYAGPSHGALSLTGPLTLDGAGNPNTVFIFQTNASLITATGSTVNLINGAQECNVFWQVGSSATLGTGSVFVGNIMALSSITVNNSVTVHGRALARNGAVTLDNDVFTSPTCATSLPATTTTTPGTPTTGVGGPTPTGGGGTTATPGTPGSGPGVPRVTGPPRTGVAPLAAPSPLISAWTVTGGVGTMAFVAMLMRRRRQIASSQQAR
ncbi:MAG: ice-binding family protein [Acidimicrobiia bacterium]